MIVAVDGMRRERGFELSRSPLRPCRRMQRDGVDVGETRVARLQRRGAREFSQRGVASIQARQHQPERVVEHGALPAYARSPSRRMRSPSASRPSAAIHVGEIHVRGNRGAAPGESPTAARPPPPAHVPTLGEERSQSSTRASARSAL